MNLSKCSALFVSALFCWLPFISFAQTADFEADVLSGCPPSLVVKFTDKTVGATSWNWNFGNGNTSIEQNPSAIYSQPGTYSVSLTINGGSTKTKNAYITVYEKPTVDFITDVTAGCTPLGTRFTNKSSAGTGAIASYSWVFGDGGTSTEASPSYTYISASAYSVTLTVTNTQNCSASLVKNALINATGPVVNFGADKTRICEPPATVKFSNSTTGSDPISYQWNFGDQTEGTTTAVPDHIYTSAGVYDVSLTAKDVNGCISTVKKNAFIAVASEPGVAFSVSSSKICVGQSIAITNEIAVPVNFFEWDFGNGVKSSEVSPVVAYDKEGFYNLTLNASLPSGCKIAVVKKIEVAFDARPAFKITEACNRKVTFTNDTQFAVSFLWDFGDGITSTEKDPVHTYPVAGLYLVKLKGLNAMGCAVEIEREIVVNGNPQAGILPDLENSCTEASLAGCAPFTIQFKDNTASNIKLKSTLWNFGDDNNNTSSSATPTHTYTKAGTYEVRLIVTSLINCVDTVKATVKVSATKPTADFSVEKTSLCVNEGVKFTNLSSAGSDFWCWDFGDDSGSNEEEPEHSYSKPGKYTVILTAKSAGCSDVVIKTDLITVNDPYLKFSVNKSCTTPHDITLVNESEEYDEIEWDLGEGNTTTQANNVKYHYAETGTYKVKLTIKNATTGCEVTETREVTVQDIKADFVPGANPICKNNFVEFKDQSRFAKSWIWNFGEGSTSIDPNPVRVFTTPGDYDVSLTVTDSDNCSDTKVVPVKVANMQGAFSYSASSTCSEFNVNFHDLSQADPPVQNWLWDFGDGTTSTEQHPSHVYTQQQSFPVRLTLQNIEATCSILASDAVTFTVPVPDFSAPKNELCVNEPIVFVNSSKNAQTFKWDFGNTITSTDPTASAVYGGPGKYTITFSAKDQFGCEQTIVKTSYIEVLQPIAKFEAFQTSAECPPLITTFVDRSSPDVTSWKWNFGDGQSSALQNPTNTYLIPGDHTVSLEISNTAGCTASFTVENQVLLGGPYGDFSITSETICANDSVSFLATATNTEKYIWDFGDGNVLNTSNNLVTHVYSNAAPANLSLILVDNKGCRVTVGNNRKIDVKGKPEVDFTFDQDYPFENEPITFTAVVKEDLDFIWKFDDQAVGGEKTIEKAFDVYGTHDVVLTGITTDGCEGSALKQLLVQGEIHMIPNVFTPNEIEDEFNPTFEIEDVEKGFWKLVVINRWGQRVYSSPDYKNDWEAKGLSSGVYYYLLTNLYRQNKEYKGYVQVIR